MSKTATISLRLTKEDKARLERAAKADGRSLANYINRRLELYVAAQDELGCSRVIEVVSKRA